MIVKRMSTALFMLCLFSTTTMTESVNEKTLRVENGLLPLDSGFGVFLRTDSDTSKKMNLRDRMKHYKVPGVGIAIIHNFSIEWTKSYGVLENGNNTPVASNTIFSAESVSKSVTALTTMNFVDRGFITLDEDVNDKLKSWKVPKNKYTADKKVTLRWLLTHVAGINRPENGFDIEGNTVPSTAQVLLGELPAKNLPATVESIPGEKYNYSNFGFIIIQQLLEDIAGKPFYEIVEDTVFNPLSMNSSTFKLPLSEKLMCRTARPHDNNGNPGELSFHPSALGQGGMKTTPSDLALFALGIMSAYNGEPSTVISEKSAKLMLTPEFSVDPVGFGGFNGLGLGIFLCCSDNDLYFSYAGGSFAGMMCVLIALPEKGQGAVIMTNGLDGDKLYQEILFSIAVEYDWPLMYE